MTSNAAPNTTISEPYHVIESRITQGIDILLQRGGKPNISAAAREFNVPEQRFRARWNGRKSKQDVVPWNRKLKEHEELAVCSYLDRLDKVGLHARLFMISDCANGILRRAHVDEGPPPQVSEHWARRFLERHPEYLVRKQSVQEIDRKNAQDPDTILWWLHEFKRICDEYGIQQCDIYNFDESGFRIGVGKNQWIVTRILDRQLSLGSNTNRETVTVVEAISGDGYVLPPMVILKGVLLQERWFTTTNIGDDYLIAVSDTGYSNDVLCFQWIKHFERFTTKRRHSKWRLLLLDGYGSHCTKEFLDFCNDHHIIPFCLPPHTTHLLQPLDVVCFQPYKHFHAEAVDAATRTGCSDFNKLEFLAALSSIREQTFKRTTVLSAFRQTGLIPFNPDIVLSKLPRAATTPSPPSTPPANHTPELSTVPLSIRSFKRQANELWEYSDPTSPTFRKRLHTYLTGSIAQAQTGVQVAEDLERTEAAQLARKARQTASHRPAQKGGQLYSSEARSISTVRVEDELVKAKALVDRAAKAEAKKERKGFLDSIMAKRSEMMKVRTARKKLRVELGKELKAKVRALKKASAMCR